MLSPGAVADEMQKRPALTSGVGAFLCRAVKGSTITFNLCGFGLAARRSELIAARPLFHHGHDQALETLLLMVGGQTNKRTRLSLGSAGLGRPAVPKNLWMRSSYHGSLGAEPSPVDN